MEGTCMCCKAAGQIYPTQSQLGPATLDYCAFCVQYFAEPFQLLQDILGTPDPSSKTRIPYYDAEIDWYRDYMTGAMLEPAKNNAGKEFSRLSDLRDYADHLQAEYDA